MRRTPMHMRQDERGFTVLELVVTVAIFTIIMGVMFQQIDQASQSSTTQRTRLDIFQETRAHHYWRGWTSIRLRTAAISFHRWIGS